MPIRRNHESTMLAEQDASAALSQARAARAAANLRPWAKAFFAQVEHVGLPLATLNDIVADSTTLDQAMARIAQKTAAGEGQASLRKAAQVDVAARISAAHGKAHRPRSSATRR